MDLIIFDPVLFGDIYTIYTHIYIYTRKIYIYIFVSIDGFMI